jgi:UDP-N-acetylglucosamine 2-epimerase (non-hydrolysing)
MKFLLTAGARPNFMKIAPILHAFRIKNLELGTHNSELNWKLIHTGQHYDPEMSETF